jgi:hypothetical protein
LTVELTRLALSKNKLKERKQQMKNKADRSTHEPSFTVGDIDVHRFEYKAPTYTGLTIKV